MPRRPAALFDGAALNSGSGSDWLDKLELRKAEGQKPKHKAKADVLPGLTESQIQKQCIAWVQRQHPGLLIHSIPNGGLRNPRTGALLKAEGALAGAADLLVVHCGYAHYIEMKRPGGRQEATQRTFQQRAKQAGACYWLCYSLDEFITTIGLILTWDDTQHFYHTEQ